MRFSPWIGIACVAAIWLSGCTSRRPANVSAPATMPLANQPEADPLATWDDRPPPPGAGRDHAPPQSLSTEQAISAFEKRIAKNPSDSFALTVLGRLHLRRAKVTGNTADTAEAVSLFRRAMQADPDYSAPPMFLAIALQEQHQFAESLALAEDVLRRTPKNTLALAIVGDAQLELGRYEQAATTYQKLAAAGRSAPVLARLARLAELKGKPDEAMDLLRTAADQQTQAAVTGPDRAWYDARLGEINFDIGRFDAAEHHYLAALQADPKCEEAIAGQATVLAARGQLKEAIEWQTRAVGLKPDLHGLGTLGDLYAAIGQSAKAEQNFQLAEKAGLADTAHRRHLARFYCDHDRKLDVALHLAQEDLNTRQDIFAYDTLAWALYKTDRASEAAPAIEKALKLGTQSPPLFYHAGMIYQRLGDSEKAKHLLERALALNPQFSLVDGQNARRALGQLAQNASAAK